MINQVVECSKDRLSVINKDYDLQKNSVVLKNLKKKEDTGPDGKPAKQGKEGCC